MWMTILPSCPGPDYRQIEEDNLNQEIGDGILKTALRKELDEVLSLRCSYNVGDPAVTVVTIK